MILVKDVLAAIKLLWDTSLAGLAPGGLWEGRPKQAAADPYGIVKVEDGAKDWTSGAVYVHHFAVTLSVWSASGATSAGLIQRALWALLNRDQTASLTVAGADKCLDIFPQSVDLSKDPATRDSKDVCLSAYKWELVFQAQR